MNDTAKLYGIKHETELDEDERTIITYPKYVLVATFSSNSLLNDYLEQAFIDSPFTRYHQDSLLFGYDDHEAMYIPDHDPVLLGD